MGRVTVVGSYIVALVMDAEQLPAVGETVMGRNYHMTFGGKGSNVAVCAARLGAESSFMGKIGRDALGRDFVSMLQKEGVESGAVLYSTRFPTGVGFILHASDGTNFIVIDVGANGDLSVSDILEHEERIRLSDVVISPLEIPLETALATSSIAASHGVKTILNPAPAVDFRGYDLQTVFAFTPNETEARICLGLAPNDPTLDEEIASAILDLGMQHVMLTRGQRGVLWASRNGIVFMPALHVNPIDTVGAGDAFNAGLAVGLSEGLSVAEAIALGVTTASLSTEKRETIPSYPYRSKVDLRVGEVLRRC